MDLRIGSLQIDKFSLWAVYEYKEFPLFFPFFPCRPQATVLQLLHEVGVFIANLLYSAIMSSSSKSKERQDYLDVVFRSR